MNLTELLNGLPDIAVYTLGTDVSRGELVASAEGLGRLLTDTGMTTGQVVAAMLPNDATTIAALFGTWRAGGVYTPLNPRTADAELITQLETLCPVAVITTPTWQVGSPPSGYLSSPARICHGRQPRRPPHPRTRGSTTPTSRCCNSPRAPPVHRSPYHFVTPRYST